MNTKEIHNLIIELGSHLVDRDFICPQELKDKFENIIRKLNTPIEFTN